MRHNVDGRKFGRNTSHRMAMFRNMANSVIEKEQIVTTVEKAKEARRVVDRLITLGKSGSPAARRLAFDRTRSDEVVAKLFTVLAERYKGRNPHGEPASHNSADLYNHGNEQRYRNSYQRGHYGYHSYLYHV